MLRTRVIPALLLRHESLVKTRQFGRFTYVGDPCNTLRIFNELEVDELVFLDITATREGRGPNLPLLADIARECFMPLGYGGGIQTIEHAASVFDAGFEKVVVNSHGVRRPELISELAAKYGSQSIIASIDVKKGLFGAPKVYIDSGRKRTRLDPVEWAFRLEELGAGEILLTSVDREGTWEGLDLELIRAVSDAVRVPLIAQGGAGTVADIGRAVKDGGASAVAVGSMVVFQKEGMGVLVNFPDPQELRMELQ
jgi:cyclase